MKQNSINSDNAYLSSIYWDGDTTDKVHFGAYYKVSSSVPCNLDDLIGGTITKSNGHKYNIVSMEIIDNGAYYTATDPESAAVVALFTKQCNGVERGIYFQKGISGEPFVQQLTFYRSCYRF